MNINPQEIASHIGYYFHYLEQVSGQVLEELGAPKGPAYLTYILYSELPKELEEKLDVLEQEALIETDVISELAKLGVTIEAKDDNLFLTRWMFALANFIGFYM